MLLLLLACNPPLVPAADAVPVGSRLVAIGDLHADLDNALQALSLAGVVDASGSWAAGHAVFVQTGDVVDRGDDSKEILELLRRLQGQAAAAGGAVHPLLGNHEAMNLSGDWRYVTKGDVGHFGSADARRAALSASGELGGWLRGLDSVVVVQGVAFCHGGVRASFAAGGAAHLSERTRAALSGVPDPAILGSDGPLWYRGYLQDPEATACTELDRALQSLGASRMVVGHTTRDDGRIGARCGGKLLGIDTGISDHYGSRISALEIIDGDARALYSSGPVDLQDP